jgi:hypothetical protein
MVKQGLFGSSSKKNGGNSSSMQVASPVAATPGTAKKSLSIVDVKCDDGMVVPVTVSRKVSALDLVRMVLNYRKQLNASSGVPSRFGDTNAMTVFLEDDSGRHVLLSSDQELYGLSGNIHMVGFFTSQRNSLLDEIVSRARAEIERCTNVTDLNGLRQYYLQSRSSIPAAIRAPPVPVSTQVVITSKTKPAAPTKKADKLKPAPTPSSLSSSASIIIGNTEATIVPAKTKTQLKKEAKALKAAAVAAAATAKVTPAPANSVKKVVQSQVSLTTKTNKAASSNDDSSSDSSEGSQERWRQRHPSLVGSDSDSSDGSPVKKKTTGKEVVPVPTKETGKKRKLSDANAPKATPAPAPAKKATKTAPASDASTPKVKELSSSKNTPASRARGDTATSIASVASSTTKVPVKSSTPTPARVPLQQVKATTTDIKAATASATKPKTPITATKPVSSAASSSSSSSSDDSSDEDGPPRRKSTGGNPLLNLVGVSSSTTPKKDTITTAAAGAAAGAAVLASGAGMTTTGKKKRGARPINKTSVALSTDAAVATTALESPSSPPAKVPTYDSFATGGLKVTDSATKVAELQAQIAQIQAAASEEVVIPDSQETLTQLSQDDLPPPTPSPVSGRPKRAAASKANEAIISEGPTRTSKRTRKA